MAGDNEAVPVDRLSSLSQEEFVAALDGVYQTLSLGGRVRMAETAVQDHR